MLYRQIKLFLKQDWIHKAVILHKNIIPKQNLNILSLYSRIEDLLLAPKGLLLKVVPHFIKRWADKLQNIYQSGFKKARATIF